MKTQKKKSPPIDWLKAIILERKQALDITFDDLSVMTGISKNQLCRLFGESPWGWTSTSREAICTALGIGYEVQAFCLSKRN